MRRNSKTIYFALTALVIVCLSALFIYKIAAGPPASTPTPQAENASKDTTTAPATSTYPIASIAFPIARALERVTKKPFGIYIRPKDSPVTPEKFTGYHTGADFETDPNEQDSDIPIFTVCAGPLLLKEWARGYGGVAVQKCRINAQDVTIVYGHLKLTSIQAKTGASLTQGQELGALGKGYSTETDGERKHLHLAIHRGTAINILGYVQNRASLDNWIDPLPLLKQGTVSFGRSTLAIYSRMR